MEFSSFEVNVEDPVVGFARQAGIINLEEAGVLEHFRAFAKFVADAKEEQMIRDGWRKVDTPR